ncbi:hypothetical protein ACFWBV_15105 [Streptomyces sp. NPDC060030]|uniref:hypothetical protein n=1 Tax=Streptomyces sp. NPDC060030 TaxID=3347042 RepID=UPI0036747656
MKSAGFREALAAHRQAWPGHQTDPTVQAKKERQIRERLREPEELFADGLQALSDLKARTAATTDNSRSSDAARTRAACGRARRIPPGPALLPYAHRPARLVIVGVGRKTSG